MITKIIESIHENADQRSSKASKYWTKYCSCYKIKIFTSFNSLWLDSGNVSCFGSKWLQNELSKLGYSYRYDEVTRYKRSVVCNKDINDFLKGAL